MSRNLLGTIWNSFIKSFKVKPERLLGEFKGEDYLGNKYYELPPDPRGGRSRASRWFESNSNPDYLDQELPPEWIAWLRRRRELPPTNDEIIRNLAISEMKKRNSANKFASADIPPTPQSKYHSSYPDYGDEFEKFPGQHYDRGKSK